MTEKVMVRNAADPDQVEKAKEKSESLNDQRLNDVREILNSVRGRRFYWELMVKCGIFDTRFAGESSNTTAFNLGERNIGLQLLAAVNEAAPEAYTIMLRESKER